MYCIMVIFVLIGKEFSFISMLFLSLDLIKSYLLMCQSFFPLFSSCLKMRAYQTTHSSSFVFCAFCIQLVSLCAVLRCMHIMS